MKQNPKEVSLFDIEKGIDNLNNLDDLNRISMYLKLRKEKLAKNNKYNLAVGQNVTITGSGKVDRGKIVKINRKRAIIDCYDKYRDAMVEYSVPFSMIRVN